MPQRDLRALFDPASVALVGASDDPTKWGYQLARSLLRGAHRRSVHLVRRSGGDVLGQQTYRSLADLPASPELVVVAVPRDAFPGAVDAALAAGARAIIGITAGLGELGSEQQAEERELAARVRAAGACLLGPNCLGVFDPSVELEAACWVDVPRGPVGIISQSGNLILELAHYAPTLGLGFSRCASLGNQADLDAAAVLTSFIEHDPTRVIALYVEDFRDGRAFVGAARSALDRGKPVVLLAAGASDAGVRAAESHTGALVSDAAAIAAACRAGGIVRVRTPKELVDTARALLVRHPPRGRRVAALADGGGHGVIAADTVSAAGLSVPRLSPRLAGRLSAELSTARTTNPIDLIGAERDLDAYARITRLLLASDEIDSLLLTGYFGGYSREGGEMRDHEVRVARALAEAAADAEKPMVAHTWHSDSPAVGALRDGGVPVYTDIETATRSLARLVELGEALGRPADAKQLPPREQPLSDAPGYFETRALLGAAGISFAPARRAATASEARDVAAQLGYPVVVKALGRVHKSEGGGVVVGIHDERELATAIERLAVELSADDLSVEQMAPLAEGVELIIGARHDPHFGPLALVGLGGVYTETFADVAVALAPLEQDEAEELLRSLVGAPLLLGARGRPPLDVAGAAAAATALARVAAAHPELAELEINPLLVLPRGVVALDARAVVRES